MTQTESSDGTSEKVSSRRFARLGIARTLLVMLSVPIVGLLGFSCSQVAEKREQVHSMTRLEELTALAIATSQMAHGLQRERGRTAIYLGSPDREAGPMNEQRALTDEAITAFEQAVTRAEGIDGETRRHVDAVKRMLRELGPFRVSATARGLNSVRGAQFYTDFIAIIIPLMSEIVDSANTASVALALTSLESLVRLKELAGQERAFGLAVLSGGMLTPEKAQGYRFLLGRQIAFGDLFLAHASDAAVAEYRSVLAAPFEADVVRIRPMVLARLPRQTIAPATPDPAGAPLEPVLPTDPVVVDAWWTATTAKIDALFVVEQLIERDVLQDATSSRESASGALNGAVFATVLCLLVSLGLAFFLGRGLIRSFTEASDTLSRVVREIGSYVRQQSASVAQTAASVNETTTTIEEIRKTAETASARSQEMSGRAETSRVASEKALGAISQGTDAMQRIRTEVEGIATGILALSEKNIQIGDIVTSVGGIAEQSNLLAVNASIEAAKAGEHGRGFSVVASEVKALSQQSKQATHQIRSILQDVQKSSNSAVMVTEQGVKRVEEGAALIEDLGHAIHDLRDDIDRSADSASQISLISNQQLAGIEQITDAMRNISVASMQNAQGAKQIEAAAHQIELVSHRILLMVNESSGRERIGSGTASTSR